MIGVSTLLRRQPSSPASLQGVSLSLSRLHWGIPRLARIRKAEMRPKSRRPLGKRGRRASWRPLARRKARPPLFWSGSTPYSVQNLDDERVYLALALDLGFQGFS